jgi:hypothetical protein
MMLTLATLNNSYMSQGIQSTSFPVEITFHGLSFSMGIITHIHNLMKQSLQQ